MIVYFAADLLWSTRIGATAREVQVPARPVRSVEMLRARLADSDIRGAIVDLDSPEIAMDLIGALREGPEGAAGGLDPQRRIRIVAFGPHVEVELLEGARRAGADLVLVRGAFDRRLGPLLRELEFGEGGGVGGGAGGGAGGGGPA